MEKNTLNNDFNFLHGDSSTTSAIKKTDWSGTSLGSISSWPGELKIILNYSLASKIPTLIVWNTDLITFYNDAFSSAFGNIITLGTQPELSIPVWQSIEPGVTAVKQAREAFVNNNLYIPIVHNNMPAGAYWEVAYTPLHDVKGDVNGVSVTFSKIPSLPTNTSITKEILQKEKALRSIIKSAPFPIGIYVGPDMVIEFANKALLDIWGKGPEIIGRPYADALPDLAMQNIMKEFLQVYETGIPYRVDNRYIVVEKEGGLQHYYLNYSFTPLFDNSGKIYGIMSSAADVTELNLSKQRIEKSEVRFHSLIAEAPVATCLFTGPEMKIEVANQKMLSVWGKDASIIGKPLKEVIPELIGQPFIDILENVFKTGITYSDTDARADLVVDGLLQTFYFDFTYKPLRNEKGEVYGVMDMAVDVTEKVLAKRKIEREKSRFNSLIEEAPVATALFIGREMKIEIVNEKMLKIWGKDGSIKGKPLADGVPELVGQSFLDILDNVFTTGETYENTEARAELQIDGVMGTYYFDFTYKPIRNEKGEVYGIINMVVDVTTKVVSNQRIVENQKQLLDSFEQSPVGIAILNKEGLTFTMVNAFFSELVGRSTGELINKPLLEALPELNGKGFDTILHEVIATGIPFIAKETAVDLLRKGIMETIYVDFAYQPRRESDGSVSGIFVVVTDVTQQVLSRKKIEASEARIRSIIESAPAGMGLFVGRDLIVELPNQTFIDIVGKGWDIVGKPLREAMPELLTEGQPFLKILDDVFTTGIMYHSYGAQVKIVQHGVMTYNYYNITYSPLFDENGEVYAILDIAIDVTETILARQKAEEAGKALLDAIELAELAAWSYNIKDHCFTYSQRFMDWLGFAEETVDADLVFSILPQNERQRVADAIKEAVTTGGTGLYKNEHHIINKITGVTRIINAQAQIFHDAFGNPEVLTGTARDVTQERELQQRLENQVAERTEKLEQANAELAEVNRNLQKSNSELGQFAYIASHDLQEPVRKISTFIKMLENTLGNSIDDRSKFYIQRIENSTQRMTSLIRDILGYSQLAKDTDIFEMTDLNTIAKDVITDFELIIEQKSATVKINKMPVVNAIPLQMTQLFGNLISNSLKYCHDNVAPVITVEASVITEAEREKYRLAPGAGYYRIEFKDNGIGFKQDYAQQIFNIFQRLHSKNEYYGTGIGLAMCKKIVQNHGGDIMAFSAEGGGAKFTVLLPAG